MNPTKELYIYLQDFSPVGIALSGGMDSSTLTAFCARNRIAYKAYTLAGPHLTDFELERVFSWTRRHSINHQFLFFNPLTDVNIRLNCALRCYYCKSASFFFLLKNSADEMKTFIDGTREEDLDSYRPGVKALQELNVRSPFADLGFDRSMIIDMARSMDFYDLDRYSRSCILTRFEYGLSLSGKLVEKIRIVEDYLLRIQVSGFRLRMFKPKRIVLQVDRKYAEMIKKIGGNLDSLMRDQGLYPYELQFMDFDEISGYFDQKRTEL